MRWLVAGIGVLMIALVYLAAEAENHEAKVFMTNCMSIPKSEKECRILLSVKQSADSARNMAAFAVGFSAANSGAR